MKLPIDLLPKLDRDGRPAPGGPHRSTEHSVAAGRRGQAAHYKHQQLSDIAMMTLLLDKGANPTARLSSSTRPKGLAMPSAFERVWRYPAQAALFLIGLVNGGVPLHGLEAGTWALPAAVVVGRSLGLLAGVAFARAIGMHMPNRLSWRTLEYFLP